MAGGSSTSFVLEVVVAVATVALVWVLGPELLNYRRERRDRQARIKLNLEVSDPRKNAKPVYGLDGLLNEVRDILDRVSYPESYVGVETGNEVLLVGPTQSGKKALAYRLAKEAGMDRVITVHDPRDPDVLARASYLIEKQHWFWSQAARKVTRRAPKKIMLLLPTLNDKQEAWPAQLETLIEIATARPNIFVVGTAEKYHPTGTVSTWFGTVLPLPGAEIVPSSPENSDVAWQTMMRAIISGYVDAASKAGYHLSDGLSRENVIDRVLKVANDPAAVEDIMALCRTTAIFNRRQKPEMGLDITSRMLDQAIRRAVPSAALAGGPGS